jgi:lipopolysaccharide export system permease protein
VKTLHFYLLRQVLATLVMTVVVFTFVLLLGNVLKEIIGLLINRQATLFGVAQAIGLLIPFVLSFALPMGMLTAALLVFGRFSADQELTAARASGISLISLITPILILSLLLCGLSAWINMQIAPQCRIAYKSLLLEMGKKATANFLPEGRFDSSHPPYTFYIGRIEGEFIYNVVVFENLTNDDRESYFADRGRVDVTNGQMRVLLYNAHHVSYMDGVSSSGEGTIMLKPGNPFHSDDKPPLSDMTFRQLRAELKKVEQQLTVTDAKKITKEELLKQKKQWESLKSSATMPILFQINREIAGSFACFGFTLIGIPLGIRAHRRETNIGIAMALMLVLIYYSFVILGQSFQTRAEFAPQLIIWLPNFIFQAIGGVMLWRANRGI